MPPTTTFLSHKVRNDWVCEKPFRYFSKLQQDLSKSMLIIDSAADQTTGGGDVWYVAHHTDKNADYYNCIQANKEPVVHTFPIAGACAVVAPPLGEPFITLFY